MPLGTDGPDVVVLHGSAHGISMAGYADALRERLPDLDVRYAATPAAARDRVVDAPVVTGGGIDADLLERAEALELFACTSAGYEHLPLDALEARDVVVTNGSGVHAPNIAEQILGYLLLFARRLDEAVRRTGRREWRHFQAREFGGSTVTVVGLGTIGTATVERLDGFGVHTVGARYTPEKGSPTDEVVGFRETEPFREALSRTDYLVVACPLSDATRGLIGATEIDVLPPDAVVVNVGRGPIVETDALVTALRKNGLRGAALDVTDPEPLPEDHPLWGLENVVVTPHNAGHTPVLFERLGDLVAGNVERARESGYADADLENRIR